LEFKKKGKEWRRSEEKRKRGSKRGVRKGKAETWGKIRRQRKH